MNIQKVLCPVDFSEHAANAARSAAAIAREMHASLCLLHVYHAPVPMTEYTVISEPNQTLQVEETSLKRLEKLRNSLDLDGVKCTLQVNMGFAHDEIMEQAQKTGADLIVMGTLGSSSFFNRWLGSITQSVMADANIPVLAIPEDYSWQGVDKIAFATDFGDLEGNRYMDLLLAFSKRFNAHVQVVNINKEVQPVTVEHSANALKLEYKLNEVHHSWHYVDNEDVTEGLNNYLSEHDIDLLAMAPRKHGYLHNLFGKSTTRKMAGICEVPLLTLPCS